MEVTVQEAKTQLSRLLRRVEAGETITIRRGRTPVAVLSAAPVSTTTRQIWGSLEGHLGPEFDEIPGDFAAYAE